MGGVMIVLKMEFGVNPGLRRGEFWFGEWLGNGIDSANALVLFCS